MAIPKQIERGFNKPQVGIGMTHELGSRPWQNPAQLVKIEDVINHYVERLSTDEAAIEIANILDMGVPVTTLANTIQLAGVMEGRHTIDTGMMVIPVLMEMMMLVGDKAGVKYNTGMEEDVKAETRDANIASVLEELEQSLDENEEEMMEEETVEAEEEPMGLMSRRAS